MSRINKNWKSQGMNDAELISRYLSGDNSAFDEIYEKYKRQLFAYLRKMLPGKDSLCDDIFQQAWIKAIDNFNSYKDNEYFLAWIMRISHNLAMDYFRKYSKEYLEDMSSADRWEALSSSHTPSRELILKEMRESLDKCVSKLSPEQREVFLLRADGISFKDITKIQHSSINTALARMQYALKNLRNCLKNRTGDK
jgi:RNA polymerase sigma-70 factor (ECF subfamily)